MKQTIDISPGRVQPIAAAGVRFMNLESTLIPGNLKNQLAVLEVLLSGLSAGELLLAPPAPPAVESDVKIPGADKEPDKVPAGEGPKTRPPIPTTEELAEMQDEQTGAGEGQSG